MSVLDDINKMKGSAMDDRTAVELMSRVPNHPVATTIWKQAILAGPYLKRMRCQIKLDKDGKILDCNRIHSVYSNTPKFDPWFRALYAPVVLKR